MSFAPRIARNPVRARLSGSGVNLAFSWFQWGQLCCHNINGLCIGDWHWATAHL